MRSAIPAVAKRTGAGTGHVILAAYAVALYRRTGHNPSVAQLVVGNRFLPRVRRLGQPARPAQPMRDRRHRPGTRKRRRTTSSGARSPPPRKLDVLDADISFDAGPDAFDVAICADTHRLAPADTEALAMEIERAVVEDFFGGAVETAEARPTQG
ncbi:hypothetical protein [Dactylosporangium salmoneum]|uniref:Condensation domain-containing protein n=1 Tax=Dactylosporangium salmoneum TaxID=53361 RepID=A0ABN3GAK6_9ACTN